MMKYISKTNNSIVQPLIISLIGVSIFNVLPVLFLSTSNFSFVIVFAFTVFFLFKIIFSGSQNKSEIQSNFLYIALLFWTIIIFFKGFNANYDYIRSLFISPYVFLPYLLPFTVKFFSIYDLKKIFSLIHYVNIIYLLFILLFFIQPSNDVTLSIGFVEEVNKYFAFPNFLLLFSLAKLPKKERLISIIVFIIGFLISIFAARRSLTWTFGCAFFLLMYMLYVNSINSFLNKTRLILVYVIIGLSIYFIYNKYEETFFGNIIGRLDQDTRGSVVKDFNNDMNSENLIFGKGLDGTYLLKETDRSFFEGVALKRDIIEAGYMNIILKGGLIHLFLFLIIFLVTIINGLFKSKNNYSKAFAVFILLQILEAYPAGVLTFNLRFFLIWYCIAMCWNKQFLQSSDGFIDSLLKSK